MEFECSSTWERKAQWHRDYPKLEVAFRPAFFISGGQTGADSIPLTIHEQLSVGLRGYLPRGFQRADGWGRAIARRYGLWEGWGGYRWRDEANVSMSDAVVAFLSSAPKTGRGTMSTVNLFVNGRYQLVPLTKPDDGRSFLLLDCAGSDAEGRADRHSWHRWVEEEERRAPQTSVAAGKVEAWQSNAAAPRQAWQWRQPSAGKHTAGADDFPYSHTSPKYPIGWDRRSKQVLFTRRPALVFWDINEERLEEDARVLRDFLLRCRPENLMFSGCLESTYPGVEKLGAALVLQALSAEESVEAPFGG